MSAQTSFWIYFFGIWPQLPLWLIFTAALWFYVFPRRGAFTWLTWLAVATRLVYSAAGTWAQYYVWSQNALARNLLQAYVPSNDFSALEGVLGIFGHEVSYFLVYSWGRFWLSFFLALAVAAAFWAFLLLLRRHQTRFFKTGETELGFLLALLAGWPAFVLFLPLGLVMVVFVSILRLVAWREKYTTLGWPMLLAAGLTLLWGATWLAVLGLNSLRI